MSRPLRPALLVLVTGLLSAALLYGATRWMMPVTLAGPIGDGSANGRERGWFTTRGFHRPEIETTSARQFSWTSRHAEVRVPNIDRRRPYRVTFRIRAGRSSTSEPPPHVILSVDGVPALTTETANERKDYDVDVPVATRSTLVVGIDVSDTFVPGPADRRELGVVVEDVAIGPVTGRWRPTGRIARLLALATMASVAVALACGFTPVWTIVTGALVAAANVWLLTRDGTFLGPYIERLINIAAGTVTAGLVAAVFRRRWPRPAAAPEWSVAVGPSFLRTQRPHQRRTDARQPAALRPRDAAPRGVHQDVPAGGAAAEGHPRGIGVPAQRPHTHQARLDQALVALAAGTRRAHRRPAAPPERS